MKKRRSIPAIFFFTVLFLFFHVIAVSRDKSDEVFPELWVGSAEVSSIRVGIFVQVGNWDLWDELASSCIDNVFHATHVQFLIVSSHEGNHENLVRERYPTAETVIVPNFGADVAAFFLQLTSVGRRIKDAEYILKIHTKTRDWWRRGMLEPICGETVTVQRAITSLKQSPRVGVLGALDYTFFVDGNDENIISQRLAKQYDFDTSFYKWYDAIPLSVKYDPKIYRQWPANVDLRDLSSNALEAHYRSLGRKERRVFNIDVVTYLKATSYPRFIAGTCAWFRVAPLADFLSHHAPEEIAQSLLFEVGYFTDADNDRLTHGWERVLSLVMYARGYSTVGI